MDNLQLRSCKNWLSSTPSELYKEFGTIMQHVLIAKDSPCPKETIKLLMSDLSFRNFDIVFDEHQMWVNQYDRVHGIHTDHQVILFKF